MSKFSEYLLPLLKKPVAVFGKGVSGKAAIKLLENNGWNYYCYEQNSAHTKQQQFGSSEARKHDLVIYSPGFDYNHPWLKMARKNGCICLGELDFASFLYKGKIIGVTGTNGKTTLTLFLAKALNNLGLSAVATGNNGHPLSLLSLSSSTETVAVCEISSFQAEHLAHLKLDALLWTNFSEDHLDRHHHMECYFAAKWQLIKQLRGALLIAGKSVWEASKIYGYTFPQTLEVEIVETDSKQRWPALARSPFWDSPQRENFFLVRSYWEKKGWPTHVLEETLASFSLPKHRLQKVAEVNSISFWNDSKATNFAATHAAISTFKQPVIWIGGGKAKGGDMPLFGRKVASKVEAVFLIGETSRILFEYMKAFHSSIFIFEQLEAATRQAFAYARPGDAILFSPGFSSLDQFKDYALRGETFKKIVLSLRDLSFKA